jgi:Kef-type K+ transport system membrane component KefB
LGVLRQHRRVVPVISVAAFGIPALLGVASVYLFEGWYRTVGEQHAGDAPFTLFMAIAVSITAVPVLASIIRERGLATAVPGVLAMASAALIDAFGWLLLLGVLIIASAATAGHRPWDITLLLLAVYVAVALLVIRPVLPKLLHRRHAVAANNAPIAVALAMGSAWATAALGLHVIFGAFLAGVIMPRRPDGGPDADLLRPVLDAGRLLLPVFFIVSGLSVNIGILHTRDFELLAVICTLAIAGKVGAAILAGWLAKTDRRDSLVVGVLLNARGLTELIALNVGLQAGIIHQRLYTIMVLMALVMTAITGPLLSTVNWLKVPRPMTPTYLPATEASEVP